MQPVQPILIVDLFPPLHAELLALLSGLQPEDWSQPTVASGWSVKDMTAHLLDTDIRRISSQRDHLPAVPPARPILTYADLVAHINFINETWVKAARRISPPLLVEFLAITGPQVYALFKSLDPEGPAAAAVAWAGEDRSPNWFDLAREYTEKWMHQQQIREAVGRPGLTSRKWLHPVLDTFLRGLPHTFRQVDAADGTVVAITIGGEAGGEWSLVRQASRWELFAGRAEGATAQIRLDQDTAWRVFTKGLDPVSARARAQTQGDERLALRALELIAIMA